jgi:coenzyme F420-reducing hydrogenase alpha subunit
MNFDDEKRLQDNDDVPNTPEPPLDVEMYLRGRPAYQVPVVGTVVSREPRAAYGVAACRAVEAACGIEVPEPVEALRALCGAAVWIEAHSEHIYRAEIPSLLGCPDLARFAHDNCVESLRGWGLHRTGASLARLISEDENAGLRVRVGGFSHAPRRAELMRWRTKPISAMAAAAETLRWVADFDPDSLELDVPLLALENPTPEPTGTASRYPLDTGSHIVVDTGLRFRVEEFESYVCRSRTGSPDAPRTLLRGHRTCLAGPVARFILAGEHLAATTRHAATQAGVNRDTLSPAQSILVRAVELIHAIDEANALIEAYTPPDPVRAGPAPVSATIGPGCGVSASEAPTGAVFVRCNIDSRGTVAQACVIGPNELNRASAAAEIRHAAGQAALRDGIFTRIALGRVKVQVNRYYHNPLSDLPFMVVNAQRGGPYEY